VSEARPGDLESVRLDVWLWAARFFKTRSLAKAAIEGGKVEVGDAAVKPSRAVRTTDTIRISRGEESMEVVVYGLSENRAGAPEAQALYRETDASRIAREAKREQRRLNRAGYTSPPTRPDKHARHALRELKGEADCD
jgi:ribosome-associated heat shock protein Hsp15